jgi:hypothetical protein
MPTLRELQLRLPKQTNIHSRLGNDEVLVADSRARISPGTFVEQKLRMALSSGARGPSAGRK